MAKLNIQLTKEQQQYLALGLLVFCGGGYLYFKSFWIPTSKKIAESKERLKELESKITKAQGQAARLPKIQKELEVLNQQAVEAERKLPKKKDLPAVIDTVSLLARKSGVDLVSFGPGGQSVREYFIEVPYALSVRGSYHDIGRFFAALALEERIFHVQNVNYGAPGGEGKLQVGFTLIAYQYKG